MDPLITLLKTDYKVIKHKVSCLEEAGIKVVPPSNKLLNALEGLSLKEIKAVILAQDPYPGAGIANGMAFSVDKGVELPKSLVNIFKELGSDLNIYNTCGDLSKWKAQGVLLLNRVLTTEEGKVGAHKDKLGWEKFTNNLIKLISDSREGVVFLLWGKDAQEVENLISADKHLIIKSTHPSPLSASKGFFGSKPFSKCNSYLKLRRIEPIDWRL